MGLLATIVLALTAPIAAAAATLTVDPVKPCYRSGESFRMAAAGFTPNGMVNVTVDGATLTGSPLTADATGAIGSGLTLGQTAGERRKTLITADATNPALTASALLLVSAVSVDVKPRDGAAGHRVRINARGFTTGRTLFAHVTKGRKLLRNMRITSLKGACRTGSVRKRLFSASTKSGTYKVQFDTRRKRLRETTVKSVYTVTIYPMARRSGRASAAAADRATWTRVR